MTSFDTITSLAITFAGVAITVMGTWIAYLSLKAMKSNVNSGPTLQYSSILIFTKVR
jgi:hypothetical protein